MDHKIWVGSEQSHIRRNSDAAFHLYARLNISSVWRSANSQQHLLKLEVKQTNKNQMTFLHVFCFLFS